MSFGQRITTNDGRERAVGRGDASRRVGINSCTANLMRPPSGVVAGVPAISRSICIRRFSARSAACSNQAERCSMSADFHSAQSAPISASFLSIYEFKSSGPRRVKAKHWLGSSEQSTPSCSDNSILRSDAKDPFDLAYSPPFLRRSASLLETSPASISASMQLGVAGGPPLRSVQSLEAVLSSPYSPQYL
jgi:hypothetical protein